jgi:hypothetical protein
VSGQKCWEDECESTDIREAVWWMPCSGCGCTFGLSLLCARHSGVRRLEAPCNKCRTVDGARMTGPVHDVARACYLSGEGTDKHMSAALDLMLDSVTLDYPDLDVIKAERWPGERRRPLPAQMKIFGAGICLGAGVSVFLLSILLTLGVIR